VPLPDRLAHTRAKLLRRRACQHEVVQFQGRIEGIEPASREDTDDRRSISRLRRFQEAPRKGVFRHSGQLQDYGIQFAGRFGFVARDTRGDDKAVIRKGFRVRIQRFAAD
jgi:hypothetical protein